jgi:hypothetical protein
LSIRTNQDAEASRKNRSRLVTAIALNLDTQWETVEAELTVAEMGIPFNLLDKHQILKGNLLYSAVRKGISPAEETL